MSYEIIRRQLLTKVRHRIHEEINRLNWTAQDIQDFQNIHFRKLQEHAMQHSSYYQDKYYLTATGGSSGLRGLFVWDIDYFSIVGYAAFRYQYHDEKINPIKSKKKVAVLTAPTLIHASTLLFSLTLDDESEDFHIPVDLNINEICDELNKLQPAHLIGYSSVITELNFNINILTELPRHQETRKLKRFTSRK